MSKKVFVSLSAMLASVSGLACDLHIESAWIREAPSNASTLAGYALLSNQGNKPLSVFSISSTAFAQIEMHESLTENGMATMRAIDKLDIPAHGKVEFAPSGKHFMMMNPKSALHSGDVVAVKIKDRNGCETTVQFTVSKAALTATDAMDHSKMDHSKMDHAGMKHE
jgi:periplasmic copper chaperone A